MWGGGIWTWGVCLVIAYIVFAENVLNYACTLKKWDLKKTYIKAKDQLNKLNTNTHLCPH